MPQPDFGTCGSNNVWPARLTNNGTHSAGRKRVLCVASKPRRRTGTASETCKSSTTEDRLYAECQTLCLIFYIGHSAKEWFAECHPRQRAAHGNSMVCLVPDTRQTKTLGKLALCLVSILPSVLLGHSANIFYFFCF